MLALAAGLGACGEERAAQVGAGSEPSSSSAHDQGGRIVDLAGVLDPAARAELARRLREDQQADGRPVMVILVEQGEGESLEQFGWAVGGGSNNSGPFLLLVDTASRRVRIEGDLPPAQKASVARAMEPALRAGNHAAAVSAGLTELERLAP